ncbi:alkaline phosphatase D family protein [Acetobacter malorum]|nr:alkaline phosphatase D family protein [Acetobacter malorum]
MSKASFFSRRQALVGGMSSAASVAFGKQASAFRRSFYSFQKDQTVFPFGVASGDPDTEGFVIWTRLGTLPLLPDQPPALPDIVDVHWQVSTDSQMQRIVQSGIIQTSAVSGYTLRVVLQGLQAYRPYWYRFTALGAQSIVGRGLTLPHQGAAVSSLKVAVASCAHWEAGYYSAYQHIADDRPDLILFLGDYIYEHNINTAHYPGIVRSYQTSTASTLDGYRWRYALQKTDPSLQAAHAATSWLPIWDDHEVEDDYSGVWSSHPEEQVRNFVLRQRAAYQAWYENMPVRPSVLGYGREYKIYRRFYFGDLAVLNMLDGRQYRARQPCAPGTVGRDGHMERDTCRDLADPNRTFLGQMQEQWLFEALKDRSVLWTVIAQDLMVASLRAPTPEHNGYRYWTDTWDGFQGARNRLTDALAYLSPPSPVIFSGDYHSHFVSEIRRRAHNVKSQIVAPEFLGSSITSFGPPYKNIVSVLPENPDIKFFDSRKRGYILSEFNRKYVKTVMRSIVDATNQNSPCSNSATFIVERGSPRLVQV